ncbi:MAG: hypothetical protein ACFB22_03505 [Rhodothalassiaceae bacterium]
MTTSTTALPPSVQHALKLVPALHDMTLEELWNSARSNHPNPLCAFGGKTFSQTDEDGITLEILRRLDLLNGGTYAELGVGNGLENNTLILAALGWRGFWAGSENLAFTYQDSSAFCFFQDWIDVDNIIDLCKRGLSRINSKQLDVISLDLDGNDYHFIELILDSGLTPRLFICEYNGLFLPPIEYVMPYQSSYRWSGGMEFGASITSLEKLFARHGYRLVCCNAASGANAFFIRTEEQTRFSDVPTCVRDLFVPLRSRLLQTRHPQRLKQLVEHIFSGLSGNAETGPMPTP